MPLKECPRCGADYTMPHGMSGAISRVDHETEICPRCSHDEAARDQLGLPPLGLTDWPIPDESFQIEHIDPSEPVFARVQLGFVLTTSDLQEAASLAEGIVAALGAFGPMRELIQEAQVDSVALVQPVEEGE